MNMTTKKKDTPSGAPVSTKEYGTTPEAKSEAERLFGMINTKVPVKRPKAPGVDRVFRQLIENANRNGDCIIPSGSGTGYYRLDPENEIDEYAFRIYKSKEFARARAIIDKLETMEKSFYGRY